MWHHDNTSFRRQGFKSALLSKKVFLCIDSLWRCQTPCDSVVFKVSSPRSLCCFKALDQRLWRRDDRNQAVMWRDHPQIWSDSSAAASLLDLCDSSCFSLILLAACHSRFPNRSWRVTWCGLSRVVQGVLFGCWCMWCLNCVKGFSHCRINRVKYRLNS